MNHAVGLEDVGDGHECGAALFIFQHDVIAILHRGPQLATLDGRKFRRALAGLDLLLEIGRAQPSRNYVIGEHLGQSGFVFRLQERVHGAGRQLGEGFVGGCEHGERSPTFEGVDQASRLHRSHKRGVIGGIHRVLNDVLGGIHFLATNNWILHPSQG